MSGIDLSEFDDQFASAPAQEKDEFEKIPDGKYQALVERAVIEQSKTSGSPMLTWTLKILGPSHGGRLLWRRNMLTSRENLSWLKSDLDTCGVKIQKLSHLESALVKLLDIRLEITVRTKGEYTNVYLNRRIGNDNGNNDQIEDDKLPF